MNYIIIFKNGTKEIISKEILDIIIAAMKNGITFQPIEDDKGIFY